MRGPSLPNAPGGPASSGIEARLTASAERAAYTRLHGRSRAGSRGAERDNGALPAVMSSQLDSDDCPGPATELGTNTQHIERRR